MSVDRWFPGNSVQRSALRAYDSHDVIRLKRNLGCCKSFDERHQRFLSDELIWSGDLCSLLRREKQAPCSAKSTWSDWVTESPGRISFIAFCWKVSSWNSRSSGEWKRCSNLIEGPLILFMASFANITRQSAVDVYIVAIAVVRFIKSLLEHSYTVHILWSSQWGLPVTHPFDWL